MTSPLLLTVMSLAVGNISAIAQTKDTIYFNASWRDTTAANASYYRVRTRQGSGWLVTDYFIKGKPQMTGIFSDDSCKVRQGEFTWFDSTGIAFHKCSYTNNKKDGKETYIWPNKKMMMTGINKDDQMEGEWIGYYRNGQVAGKSITRCRSRPCHLSIQRLGTRRIRRTTGQKLQETAYRVPLVGT